MYACLFTIISVLLFSGYLPAQNNGDELFIQKCATCHTIGEGKLIGPDLQNIHLKRTEEWLLHFIISSTSFIKSGNPDAVQIFNEFNKTEMPDPKINEEEIKAVLSYIKSMSNDKLVSSGTDNTSATIQPKEIQTEQNKVSPVDLTIDPVVRGKQLFTGEYTFNNKGPSCLSCHQLTNDEMPAGGTLAKELTLAYEKYNEKGVKGLIKSPPFPVMKSAYNKHEISDEETFYLTMFLKKISKDNIYQHKKNYNKRFLYTGILGVIVLMGILPLIWSKKSNRKEENQ